MRHLILFLAFPAFAALTPTSIPRQPSKLFLNDGVFEGGSSLQANIENLRFSKNSKEGLERWVFDFSDPTTRIIDKIAPRFQLRYIKADQINVPEGKDIQLAPPKFILTLRSIQKNFLQKSKLKELASHSAFVQDFIVYPPLEDGDIAIEIVLKKNVLFDPHQPIENEGRLVLDLKAPR